MIDEVGLAVAMVALESAIDNGVICPANFQASYPASVDNLTDHILLSRSSNVDLGLLSNSLPTGTLSALVYLTIEYGPGGLLRSEEVGTRFDHDLLGMGGLPRRVADYAGTALTTTYLYGVGSAQPPDMIVGGVSYVYHQDAYASVMSLADPSGAVVASYRYDPFGNLLQAADTVAYDGLGDRVKETGPQGSPTYTNECVAAGGNLLYLEATVGSTVAKTR